MLNYEAHMELSKTQVEVANMTLNEVIRWAIAPNCQPVPDGNLMISEWSQHSQHINKADLNQSDSGQNLTKTFWTALSDDPISARQLALSTAVDAVKTNMPALRIGDKPLLELAEDIYQFLIKQ